LRTRRCQTHPFANEQLEREGAQGKRANWASVPFKDSPAVSTLESTSSGLESGCLPDLDDIVVRVTHVAANLSAGILWLGQEFGSSASPLLVRSPDVGDTNIQEAGNLIGVHRGRSVTVVYRRWPPPTFTISQLWQSE